MLSFDQALFGVVRPLNFGKRSAIALVESFTELAVVPLSEHAEWQ
jgi:hypothetical protein